MSTIKNILRQFMQATPFVLSNTIIFVPYLLFMGLSNGVKLETTLPFVLFYTFRMTGIFLLRSFKGKLETFTILIISILFGGLGCFFGLTAKLFFPLYYLSAILIGLSAAWLPASNTTVNFYEKDQGVSVFKKESSLFAVLALVVLIASLNLPTSSRMIVVLLEYGALYIAAYHTITHFPSYEIDFNEVDRKVVSVKEFVLFLVFFILLLFIRLARMLLNTDFLIVGVTGFSFLFILAAWYFNRQRKVWKLPAWLNVFTFVTGMCNNFMLLFGAFYIAVRLGSGKIVSHLYIPYILGILLSGMIVKQLYRLFPKQDPKVLHVYGFFLSLITLLYSPMFSVGIFLLSTFTSATGSFLNKTYYHEEILPKDERVIIKYSTQTKGSICHQLLLVTLLWLLIQEKQLPLITVLKITQHRVINASAVSVVEKIHLISVFLLIVLFAVTLVEMIRFNRKENIKKS